MIVEKLASKIRIYGAFKHLIRTYGFGIVKNIYTFCHL